MSPSRIASVVALLGGLVWIVSAVLAWGDEPSSTTYLVGVVLLALALAATGYALVATAPVWLRAVVTVATAALGLMVWLIVRDAVPGHDLSQLVGGAALVVGGGIGLARRGAERAQRPAGGHRAAR